MSTYLAKGDVTMIPLRLNRKGQRIFDTPARPDFLPALVIVKIKPDVVEGVPDLATTTIAAARSLRLPDAVEEPFASLRRKGLIEQVVPIFSTAPLAPPPTPLRARARGVAAGVAFAVDTKAVSNQALLDISIPAVAFARSFREVPDEDLRGINLLRLSTKADLTQVLKDLKSSRGFEYCHRVAARWPAKANPVLNRQWGLRATHWFETIPSPGASNVKVGVLDTGVDRSHPDLNTIITAYHYDGTSETDIVGHGTHVSGIIAANPDDRAGITGVSNCKLNVWKIFNDTPDDQGDYYVDVLLYLRALGAVLTEGMQVINLSIGGTAKNPPEETLFRKLIDENVTVVAAMGNEFQQGNPIEYPAAYPGVIAVGATDETDKRAGFSNTGKHISLSAPGVNILSTLPIEPSDYRPQDQTNYAAWSGTSMATPHVTAAASLIIGANPGISNKQVGDRLKATAAKIPAMGGEENTPELGAGLLDLQTAVR
jgi:subtilisin family serine protease